MQGLVHRHKHKRSLSSQTNINHGFWENFLDKITLIAGVLGPIMVIPQIHKIYSTHSASGISAFSWFAFGILDVPFIIYGIVHKDRPIIATYSMFFAANLTVAIGAIIYAAR